MTSSTTARVAIAIALVGCGSKPPPVETHERDPAWAATYEQRATAGCACKDSACLDGVHAELARIEVAHGGMDEAPPGVQAAHGAFDKCWRDGTKDVSRDLDFTTTAICACTDATCIGKVKIDMMHLTDKYGVTDVGELAKGSPAAGAAIARAAKCVADVTISAQAFLAIAEKSTAAMCKCDNVGCGQGVMKWRSDEVAKYYDVADLDTIQPRLDELNPKLCRCFGDLIAKEVVDKVSPIPSMTHLDLTMNCR